MFPNTGMKTFFQLISNDIKKELNITANLKKDVVQFNKNEYHQIPTVNLHHFQMFSSISFFLLLHNISE